MEAIQITLPSSKSLSNRWLTLSFLSRNGIRIKNLSSAEDTQTLKRLLRQLKMGRRHNFDCGNAGTVARFMVALTALTPGSHTVYGDERLCSRPMAPLFDALRSMGCIIKCTQNEGYLPVKIEGISPVANRVVVDCSQSSQFASAILFAAAYAPLGLAVELQNVAASEPYITMTLDTFTQAGINWVLKGNPPAYFVEHNIPTCDLVTIEKDWSAASYFYLVSALNPDIRLHLGGLSYPSIQGDCVTRDIFAKLGVSTEASGLSLDIQRTSDPEPLLVHDFTATPDIVPTVAVACAFLGIEGRLKGVANLRLKESDRVAAITAELQKMGCKVEATDDEIHILPSKPVISQPVDTYNDHRIAMAFGALKTIHPEIEIQNPDVVAKSFPNFFEMVERTIVQ